MSFEGPDGDTDFLWIGGVNLDTPIDETQVTIEVWGPWPAPGPVPNHFRIRKCEFRGELTQDYARLLESVGEIGPQVSIIPV